MSRLIERADFVGLRHAGALQFFGNLLMLQDPPAFQLARRAGFGQPWFVVPYAPAEPYWTVPIELFLYVGFGVIHCVFVRRCSRLQGPTLLLALVAELSVLYHAAAGFGQCLSLVWLLGWAPRGCCRPARAALLLTLRFLARGVEFYELQFALFSCMLLVGGLWLSDRAPWLLAAPIRVPSALLARISYPLYLHTTWCSACV